MKYLSILGGVILLAVPSFGAGPDHLVLTELAVRGGLYTNAHTSSEFTEIYNPTATSVTDLEHYYLTDWSSYHTLPAVTATSTLPDLGTGDNLTHFPTGTSLASGGLAVVTANGQTFLNAYFGGSLATFQAQPGSPQLFEVFDSDPSIPDMVNLNQNATDDGKNLSHTDAGENQFLFYWDGLTDLVKDVDMMMYGVVGVNLGTGNGIIVKSGIAVDGPDADTDASTYVLDSGSTENLTTHYRNILGSVIPFQYYRRSLVEAGENGSVGNGLTGKDATLEEINYTWYGASETTATATPGITQLPLSSANQAPVIYKAICATAYPQAGQSTLFQANIADDVSVASAILKVDTGSGFTDVPMANTGPGNLWTASIVAPANGSLIKWYVTATDSGGLTSSSEDFKYFDSLKTDSYDTLIVGFDPQSLQFTEIHFDPVGSDNAGESEFVEVHNLTNTAIDMSGFVFSKGSPDNATLSVITTTGTTIAANGYLIYAACKPLFLLSYPGFDPTQVVDLNWERASTLSNTADSVYLVHPNDISNNGEASAAFDSFSYSGMTQGTGAGNLGFTFELRDMDGPNESQSAWDVSLTQAGSPGRQNTLDNAGNIAITNQGRTVQYPTSSTPIVINANASGTNALIVELHYTTNPGVNYTVTPMTLVSGTQYSKDLGSMPDGTLVKYFISARDTLTGLERTYPPYAAPVTFFVNNIPITQQDLLFTEMMSDPTDVENADFSEWLEVKNRRSTPIDMSFFKIGHVVTATPYARVLPEGTVIPANGYLIFAGNKPIFLAQYPSVDPDRVVDALYVSSIIANASGNAFITDANAINWNETTWQNPGTPFEVVNYFDNSNGWPNTSNNFSRELTDLTADNNDGTKWVLTTVAGGTPAAPNSTSGVSDWSIY